MLQEESNAAAQQAVPGGIVDAVFAISCRSLPVDHAYALSQAIQSALPWFALEPAAGLHTIHGAGSGSGWMRPEEPDALLHPAQRAKLALRLPRQRLDDAARLAGSTLQVAGHALCVGKLAVRPLSRITTLFSRYVTYVTMDGPGADEAQFLAAAAGQLGALGMRPAEMLCGRTTLVVTPTRTLQTRSLMLAGLSLEHSLLLQQRGLGAERKLGCGLFIPHKDIGDLRSRSD